MENPWITFVEARDKIKKASGTRKIADLPSDNMCRDPQHEPPSMQVFEPGVYEHVCPSCGRSMHFVVQRPVL